MNTTRKDFVEQVRNHIMEEVLNTDEGYTIQTVMEDFSNWYGVYEQKRTPNRYQAFKEWFLGLPSSFSIEYRYHAIHELLKSWFEACGATYKERKPDQEADLYYHLVTREYFKLYEKETQRA